MVGQILGSWNTVRASVRVIDGVTVYHNPNNDPDASPNCMLSSVLSQNSALSQKNDGSHFLRRRTPKFDLGVV